MSDQPSAPAHGSLPRRQGSHLIGGDPVAEEIAGLRTLCLRAD